MLLKKSKGDYTNHLYYICQIVKADFIYIKILVNLLEEVFFIKYKMVNQNLIVYASKLIPGAAKNNCVTGIELCGLTINIASFAHLLKKGRF